MTTLWPCRRDRPDRIVDRDPSWISDRRARPASPGGASALALSSAAGSNGIASGRRRQSTGVPSRAAGRRRQREAADEHDSKATASGLLASSRHCRARPRRAATRVKRGTAGAARGSRTAAPFDAARRQADGRGEAAAGREPQRRRRVPQAVARSSARRWRGRARGSCARRSRGEHERRPAGGGSPPRSADQRGRLIVREVVALFGRAARPSRTSCSPRGTRSRRRRNREQALHEARSVAIISPPAVGAALDGEAAWPAGGVPDGHRHERGITEQRRAAVKRRSATTGTPCGRIAEVGLVAVDRHLQIPKRAQGGARRHDPGASA